MVKVFLFFVAESIDFLHNRPSNLFMKAADLKPSPKNPRKITDDQLSRLDKSLNEFGDLGCIVYNTQTKRIVSGHQRTKIIPKESDIVIEQEYEIPTETGTTAIGYILHKGEKYKYREVDWPETKELAANLAANKQGGEFDYSILPDVLLELDGANVDWDLTGFELDEIEDLLAPFKVEDGLTDEDSVPEVKQSFVKRGDVYLLGNHRLMCGDSTSIDAVEKLMNGEKADMVFTDPPYGMALDASYKNMAINSSKYKTKRIPHNNVIGDHEDFHPELINSIFSYFLNCKEMFLFGADYYSELIPDKNSGSWVVWDKRQNESGANLDGMFGSSFELCWSKAKHSRDIARIIMSSGYMNKNSKEDKRVHPTQKPVALVEWFFKKWGDETKSVVDLFGGSGSTLIACEKTNRKCFMMELDEHYCQVIIERWQNFTGKQATLESRDESLAELT